MEKLSKAELAAFFEKTMGEAVLDRDHFRTMWPYVFPLSRIPPNPGELTAIKVLGNPTFAERHEAACTWAKENLTVYAILGGEIGISDPDEAFWFKMTWG